MHHVPESGGNYTSVTTSVHSFQNFTRVVLVVTADVSGKRIEEPKWISLSTLIDGLRNADGGGISA